MKKNMGTTDRLIRLLIAAVIVALVYAGVLEGVAAVVLIILAGIFVLTSFVKFCPLYLPFGISTCKTKE